MTNTLLVIGATAVRLGVPFFATLASVSVNVVIELIVASVLVVRCAGMKVGAGVRQYNIQRLRRMICE